MDTPDHALEAKWWPDFKPTYSSLPPSSYCFIGSTPNKNLIKVQVAQHVCILPLRWRPIFTLIDICQLGALDKVLDISNNTKSIRIHQKLLHLYDQIRQYIVIEAKSRKEEPLDDILWMPPAVHRFCVRVVSGIAHQPKTLALETDKLQQSYSQPKWSYGKLLTT
jgi:hypothetical protein